MKAVRYHDFGGPEIVRVDEVPVPQPANGEVLIRVAASSINPVDWKIGEGHLRGSIEYPFPFIPGIDFSGVIVELGAGVTSLSVGDQVFGATPLDRIGTYAEMIAVSASVVARAPKSIALATAAAVPLAALTSWNAITSAEYANLHPGQRVLIHGGAGGTGIFAVQLARLRGAHVIATASGHNLEFLRSLGAHEVIDYQATRFENAVTIVDAVLDLVGGDESSRSIPLICKGGVLVSIASQPDRQLAERYGVRATFAYVPQRDPKVLEEIGQLIDKGNLQVTVSDEFALADAGMALAKNRKGHVRGKILLNIDGTR